jgi:hypothetical protein
MTIIERAPAARELLLKLQNRDLWPTLAVVVSTKTLDFTDIFSAEASASAAFKVRMNVAHFNGEYRYYFFNTADDTDTISKAFYELLINRSCGASIFIKERSGAGPN